MTRFEGGVIGFDISPGDKAYDGVPDGWWQGNDGGELIGEVISDEEFKALTADQLRKAIIAGELLSIVRTPEGRPHWSHFDVMAMKRIAFIQSSNVDKIVDAEELPIQLCNYVDVYYNDRITDKLAFSAGSATSREVEKFKLRPCDVIITRTRRPPAILLFPLSWMKAPLASSAGIILLF